MLKLENYHCICLDSSTFIYFIEENPTYISKVEPIFSEISYGNIIGISSYLSLLEVLVKLIKEGAKEIALQYKDLLLSSTYLKLFPLDDRIAEIAAELRAKYNGNGLKLRTPDAIQLATGILNDADLFLTNDTKLKQVKDINVLSLDDISD